MRMDPFVALPRDLLRDIVDLLEPADYFRFRKALSLEKVLRRYLVVSAEIWHVLLTKHMDGVKLSQLVRTRPPLRVQQRVVDLLDSFRIDPRTLSRRRILRIVSFLGDLLTRDQILAHIDYSTYPLDRTDGNGSSFFLWKSLAPYIEMLSVYLLTLRNSKNAHYPIPGNIADYMVMSAIIKKDIGLMRVLIVLCWYRRLRYDLLFATAIASHSWKCLEDLYERNQETGIALRILSNFENGLKWKSVVKLMTRAMDKAHDAPPTVIVSILCHYWSAKDIMRHDFWNSMSDDEIANVMEALILLKKPSVTVLNQAKFLLNLPNADHLRNPLYVTGAINSGNTTLINYLAKVGHPPCTEEWVYSCALDHPPVKRRKIMELLGFKLNDTYK